ncbi:P1 family peptidase [Actinoplanes sp. NPDC026619]|uniref:P1 family peptidase n=1 Tax=Actinoplanes sp. NPDC026619 TaxID=3155798 RepID=UPI0033E28CDA
MTEIRPGRLNGITDVAGVRVGHYEQIGDGWLTGTTVVLAPPGGAVGGVDVRGGGPGTRETDLLDPRNLVERVNAVVLGGGSAFGLDAAGGVMRRLAAAGIGFPVGPEPHQVVPIVPAAVLFDLGRGGTWGRAPDAAFGAAAYDAASDGPVALGTVGAGTGAVAGGLKGGVGSASAVITGGPVVIEGGLTVGALAVVNAAGSCVDPSTGMLYGLPFGLAGEFPDISPIEPVAAPVRGFHTTIGVVATDASLTKAQCQKLAGVTHDGMARAIRPVHSMFDGDTIFALATGTGAPLGPVEFSALLTVAADTFSRAVVHGMLAATGAGDFRSYRELVPDLP